MTAVRSILLLALLLLVACTERAPQPPRTDSSHTAPPSRVQTEETIPLGADMPFAAGAWDNPANRKAMSEIIFREYARAAASLPRRITDSIAKLRQPQLIMKATENAMVRWDSLSRRALAQKYELPVDTISAIINRGNREREAKQKSAK